MISCRMFLEQIKSYFPKSQFCVLSNSSLSPVRLGVDFVLPLSQQEQQEEQEEPPPPKISAVTDRISMKL